MAYEGRITQYGPPHHGLLAQHLYEELAFFRYRVADAGLTGYQIGFAST